MSGKDVHAWIKDFWPKIWGIVFFIGISVNFFEIILRAGFNMSVDIMFDLPIWLTIWSVMMMAGPILPEGEHVSVDAARDHLYGWPRKVCEIINCIATIIFGIVITWGGVVFTKQIYDFDMVVVRVINVPRWIVESCIPLGMGIFTAFAIYQLMVVLKTDYSKKENDAEEKEMRKVKGHYHNESAA